MADSGHGTTITISGFTGEVTNLDVSGITRESLDTSNLTTDTWRTFIPSDLIDPGQTTLDFNFSPGAIPPITELEPISITITFPTVVGGTSGGTRVCSGFFTDFSVTVDEGIMKGSGTIKWTGEPTWTAGT